MIKKILAFTILLSFLPLPSLAQDYSQVRRHSNVWVNECKTCHPSYAELAEKVGIRTHQYYFNVIYKHKNKDDRQFSTILSIEEIDFVATFLLIAAYLHKLETDMRKAGDHLQKNIKL